MAIHDDVALRLHVDLSQVVDARIKGDEVVALVNYGIGGIKRHRLPLDWVRPAPGPAATPADGDDDESDTEAAPSADDLDYAVFDYGKQEYADMTVAELQELAKERGIAYTGLRKAELIEALAND